MWISSRSRGWIAGQIEARGGAVRGRGTLHRRHALRGLGDVGELGHVLDRDDDPDLHRLAVAGVHDRDLARPFVRLPAQEPRDLLERTLRRRQADPLRRLVRDLLEPLEREREVRAALAARERVDLVDDHPSDAP